MTPGKWPTGAPISASPTSNGIMDSDSGSTRTRRSCSASMPALGVAMASTSTSYSAASFRRSAAAVIVTMALAVASGSRSAQPRFFPDDPLWADDDRAFDASKTVPVEDTNGYDFVVNTFAAPGERRDLRAQNVNTVDELPDSSWFTNRLGRNQLPAADV